jgi:hypothetical protein
MALVRIQVRRDPAATWAAANPVLAAGEPGLETDTGKIKYGDGVRAWNSLPYSSGVSLGSSVPPAAGTAAAGTSQDAARADHSHALPTNLQAQTIQASGSASVGGTLTVTGQLIGGTHRHNAADINDLTAAVFSRIVSSIKAGANIQAEVDSAAQTITLSSTSAGSAPLVITQNPIDYAATSGTATFSATAIGGRDTLTYEWQVSTDGGNTWAAVPGASGSTLVLSGVTGAMSGNRYRLQVSSGTEVVVSAHAVLTAGGVTITAQPPDSTVDVGGTVRLAVAASAGSTAISYQWQQYNATSDSWADVPEADLPVYSFIAAAATGSSGNQYRAVVRAAGQTVESRTAVVVVRPAAVSFPVQPESTTDVAGAATFAADVVGGTDPLVLRWQRLGGGSSAWSSSSVFEDIPDGASGVSGQAAETLLLTSQTASQHLRRYRLKVTDADSRVAYSAEATLRTLSLEITAHPEDVSATSGDTLSASAFSVTASADGGVTYQWQKSVNNGTTWSNIAGATSATYGGFAVTFLDDGALFRCAVTGDGQTLNSESASLAVAAPALTITTQPQNVTATGSTATFSFGHSGGPSVTPQVYWESRTASTGWVRIPGATTTTLAVSGITPENNGTAYRGVVQRGSATAFTDAVTLTAPGAIIFLQPQDATAASGNASFSVDFTSVACSAPTITWQLRTSPSGSWSAVAGAGSVKTLEIGGLTTSFSGYQYRALVACGGREVASNPATLTVPVPPVVITTQPSDATAALAQATFTFAFSGGDGSAPSIVWERALPGGAFAVVPGATTNTLAVNGITTSMSGAQYRATVTIGSQSATTRSAVLTVGGATITLHPVDAIAVDRAATFTFDFSSSCSSPSIQWESKPPTFTVWSPVLGATSRTLSLTNLLPSDSNRQYRAAVECGGSVSYSSAATLTVPSYEFFITQPGSQSVNAGDTVTFSYQGMFNVPDYQARWQMRRIGGGWSNVARGQSYTFKANARAHHNTEWRVQVATPGGVLFSAVARLTVGKLTSTKPVALAGTSDLVGIAYAKGAFVALASDQTAIIRRSTDGGDTWQTHWLPESRYWDGVTASQNGALFAYGSGESGTVNADFSPQTNPNTPFNWTPTWRDDPDSRVGPKRTATVARSLDGGRTWAKLQLPFFAGNCLRMWGTNYNNAVVAFFFSESLTGRRSREHWWFGSRAGAGGGRRRNGRLKMAVTLNDGASWSVFDWPLPPQGGAVYPPPRALVPKQVAISPSGVMVVATRVTDFGADKEYPGLLLTRNIAASGWGTPTTASTATIRIATSNGNSARTIATGLLRTGGVVGDLTYSRSPSLAEGFNVGRAITNHDANSVEWVPGAGFIAAHDRYRVAMISQDGNLWGAVPTERILGEVPLHVVGNALYGIDTTLPNYEWVTTATSESYPDFVNMNLGITTITDTVNCWAHSPSEIMLLETGGSITWIPRDDAPSANPGELADPDSPDDLTVESRSQSAVLSWTPSPSATANPPQRYDVEYTSDDGRTWTTHTAPASTATSRTVSGLTRGTTYYFRVAAVFSSGTKAYSAWSPPVTPAASPPGAPAWVRAMWSQVALPGNPRRILVSWGAPTDDGGAPITSYIVQTSDGLATLANHINLTRLTAFIDPALLRSRPGGANAATFRVLAVNSAGISAASPTSGVAS